MVNLLALDTSTDACSVALQTNDGIREIHEVIPRRHNQLIFSMLQGLLGEGGLGTLAIDAVVYAQGPGSFTGLRVCASAAQGLCYAAGLPAIAVTSLEGLAWTALREGLVEEGDCFLSTLDAQIGELYWSLCRITNGRVVVITGPQVCKPAAVTLAGGDVELSIIGSGGHYCDSLPPSLRSRVSAVHADLLPRARDLFPAAGVSWRNGQIQRAHEVAPLYVRDEISWKKLPEQGKRA